MTPHARHDTLAMVGRPDKYIYNTVPYRTHRTYSTGTRSIGVAFSKISSGRVFPKDTFAYRAVLVLVLSS